MRLTKNEILPNVFLGSVADAKRWKGVRLCVLERKEDCSEDLDATMRGQRGKHFELRSNDLWVPILGWNNSEHCASKKQLNKFVETLDELRAKKIPVLNHCRVGQERSPLALAYYLTKRENMTMDEAYRFLQSKRKIVSRRDHWLCGAKVKEYRVQLPRTPTGEAIFNELYDQSQVIKSKRKKKINVTFQATPLQADRVAYLVKEMGGEIVSERGG